jgi:hypothetical protein
MQVLNKLILGGLCAVLLLPLTAGNASAQNLLVNPDFETGDLTGWLVAGASGSSVITVNSPDNGPSAPGTNHAFLDNQAEGLALTLKQSTPSGVGAGGGTVFYSFDLKLGQAANGGVFFVEVFAEEDGVGVVASSGVLGNYTPADWTAYSGSFESPAGTDFLTIQLSAITGAVTGSVSSMLVDNVSLRIDAPVSAEPESWGGVKAQYR